MGKNKRLDIEATCSECGLSFRPWSLRWGGRFCSLACRASGVGKLLRHRQGAGELLLARTKRARTGCLEWTCYRARSGYGVLSWMGRPTAAHRLAYMTWRGALRPGDHVLHKCDNPPCCEPRHLFVGDQKANNEDKRRKGRGRGGSMPGVAHPLAKFTVEQISAIRKDQRSHAQVAREMGVSATCIWRIRLFKTYVKERQ